MPLAIPRQRVPESRANLPSLTGLRWIAAFLVFGFHLKVIEYFGPGAGASVVAAVFSAGSVGVSFFFILSGFVLMWAAPRTAFRTFWWRRFARVYPLHAATAILVLAFLAVLAPARIPPVSVTAANLALVQSWSSDAGYFQSLNTVSWTLSCEAFFYLLFPPLALAVVRLGRRALIAVAAGAWAVTLLGPLLLRLVAGEPAAVWFFHWTPLGRFPEFVLGVALAALVRLGPSQVPRWGAAVTLTGIGYLASAHVGEPYSYAACTMPGFALILVAAARSDVGDRWTPWRHPVAVRLGELSFAFYLVHLIVIRVGEVLIGYHPRLGDADGAGLALAMFLVSLAAAWLLHIAVERPARRLLLRRRRPTSWECQDQGRSVRTPLP